MTTTFYTRAGELVCKMPHEVNLRMGQVVDLEKGRFTVVAARLKQVEKVVIYSLECVPTVEYGVADLREVVK